MRLRRCLRVEGVGDTGRGEVERIFFRALTDLMPPPFVTAGNTGQVRIRGRIRGYADRWTPDGAATGERRVRGIESPPVEVAGHNLRVGHLASSRHRQVGISYRSAS